MAPAAPQISLKSTTSTGTQHEPTSSHERGTEAGQASSAVQEASSGEVDRGLGDGGDDEDEDEEGRLQEEASAMAAALLGMEGGGASPRRDPSLLPPDAASLMYASTMANRSVRYHDNPKA